jgi:S1-C subfamily serine protease
MKPGDRIALLEGTPVWTFGDLQYRLDRVPRHAKQVRIGVEREGKAYDLTVTLPERWWWTDLTFRQSSVEPRVYFDSRPLTEAEKDRNGLDRGGFASMVTHVDMFAELTKSHQLRAGDIIFAVDGAERDEAANTAELFIKLRKTAGDTVTLGVIRDGKRIPMKLKTYRLSFRK